MRDIFERTVIIGSNGMLGSAFASRDYPGQLFLLTERDIDITQEVCIDIITELQPTLIINCAAYTAVDKAEEEREKAFAVNAEGVAYIARAALNCDAFMVHFSTDYIFDGSNSQGYDENDGGNPVGAYGASKLKGEEYVRQLLPESQYLLCRTAWLYGPNGKNFVHTMLRLSTERDEVSVVNDQFGSPTYSLDVVEWVIALLHGGYSGIYHTVNSQFCSWYEFALLIFKLSGKTTRVHAVSTDQYPTTARRPQYSLLKNDKLKKSLEIPVRNWDQALSEYMNSITL